MFPDFGPHLLVVAAVALVVVGPKDLPVLLRKLGQFMAKMRGMANEFRASFDEMARQSELDELRREVQALRTGQYTDPIQAAAGAHTAEINDTFYGIHKDLTATPGQLALPEASVDPAFDSMTPLPADPEPAKPKRVRKPKAATAEAAEPVVAKAAAKPRTRKPKAAPEAGV